ncbi:MAG TPA: ribonuclease HII [Nitrospiria bacterium]
MMDGRVSRSQLPQAVDRLYFEREAYERGFRSLAGLDEAGRGPLAGPVVASAVVLPSGALFPGLRDSKKLTAGQRERFYEEISREARGIGIGTVGPEVIDAINILEATRLAMKQALSALPVLPDYLLIDAMTLPDVGIAQHGLVRGDDLSQTIAAASVIAKVTRDRLMLEYDRRYPQYNFRSHKGYGTAEHLLALKEHGPCPIHRRSFRRVATPETGRKRLHEG